MDPTRPPADADDSSDHAPSKKDQILSLYDAGVEDVESLALLTATRPSYVGGVLREEGRETAYYDLYTSTNHPVNAYSRYFAGRLGFRNEATARDSVDLIDRLYAQFGRTGDRAGQHHAMLMALTMFNRARWTGKPAEAEVFRRWLAAHVDTPLDGASGTDAGDR